MFLKILPLLKSKYCTAKNLTWCTTHKLSGGLSSPFVMGFYAIYWQKKKSQTVVYEHFKFFFKTKQNKNVSYINM